jgi:hypothetical protein
MGLMLEGLADGHIGAIPAERWLFVFGFNKHALRWIFLVAVLPCDPMGYRGILAILAIPA